MLSKKDFLGEFESLKDAVMVNAFVGIGNGRKTDVFDAIKNHNKPVVVFGAGSNARFITELLNKKNVSVTAYALDEAYYTPNKIFLNRPVCNFDKLAEEAGKYVFVCGIGVDTTRGGGVMRKSMMVWRVKSNLQMMIVWGIDTSLFPDVPLT